MSGGGKVGLNPRVKPRDGGSLRTAGWAKAQGAAELHIHATSGIAPDRTGKLLQRLGFKAYGGNYAVRVG